MKCNKCGFILNRDFLRCPYCGQKQVGPEHISKKVMHIGGMFNITVRSFMYLVFANLVIAAIIVDAFTGFSYGITFWVVFFALLPITIFNVISGSPGWVSTIQRVDLFVMLFLVLGCFLCRIEPLFDFRQYFVSFIGPSGIIIMVVLSILSMFLGNNKRKIRPLNTLGLALVRLALMIVLFVFLLVNRHQVSAGVANPAFSFLSLGSHLEGGVLVLTNAYIVSEILIYAAFGLSVAFVFNYLAILVNHISMRMRGEYGGNA